MDSGGEGGWTFSCFCSKAVWGRSGQHMCGAEHQRNKQPRPDDRGRRWFFFQYRNIVLLRYVEQELEVGRAVAILKMRNSDHENGLWTFAISDRGFELRSKLEGVLDYLAGAR
jgi:hypothetical protein